MTNLNQKKYGTLTASKMTIEALENIIFNIYKNKPNKEVEDYFKNDLFSKEEGEALGRAIVRIMHDKNICTLDFYEAEQALPILKHISDYRLITSKYLSATRAGGLDHFLLTVNSNIPRRELK